MTEKELNEIEARDDFTIHCRGDVPALIAEVRQLRAERDVLIKIYTDRDWCPREWFDDDEYDCDLSQCNATTEKCWLEWARNEVEKAKES